MSDGTKAIETIDRALESAGAEMAAVEMHGHLVGLLCAQGAVEREAWLRRVTPAPAAGDVLAAEAGRMLEALFTETVRQMNDPVLDFHPLQPDEDDVDLEDRVHALGEWCQGFLLGLSEGGVEAVERLPEDSAEIVKDLVEISRAGNYRMEEEEEGEDAYSELLEYVRTGVLLINEELNPTKAPPRTDTTLH